LRHPLWGAFLSHKIRERIRLLAIILQVTGAVLLAKGLLFRKELDLVLKIFSLSKDIDKKATKMMEYHYSESYVSLIGAVFLSLGYFLPLVGIEISYESLEWYSRLLFGLLGIGVLITVSILLSDFLGRKKASKISEEELLRKYGKLISEMGYWITGMSKEDK
jgi:hypothetical protein